MDTRNTDAGVAINGVYDSPLFFSKTPQTVSKSHKVDMYFSPTSSGTLYVEDRQDFKSAFRPREAFQFSTTAGLTQLYKGINVPLTQNVYQYHLTDSGSTAQPWKLNRIDYESTSLGMGKA